jgi:ribosomal protein L11 methyltransferase
VLKLETEGLHPSTISCLEMLEWMHERVPCSNILDIGCGNGILSVVAAQIWECQVLATDISDQAVRDATQHAAQAGLANLRVIRSDGFSNKEIEKSAPYDLIMANLLAELQLRLAANIQKHLKPGGMLLLSGILAWKYEETIAAYSKLGFELYHFIESPPWCTALLCHTIDINNNPRFTKA